MSLPGTGANTIPPGANLFDIPSKAPPPGVIPNFNIRSPLLPFAISVSTIFLPLMYIFLAIRLYMRIRQKQRWRIDDTLVVATAISCTTLAVLILCYVQEIAKHSWDVSIGVILEAKTQRIMFAQQLFNGLSLWLGKICLLTMYYRIFGHIRKVQWQLFGVGALTLPIFITIFLQPALVAPPPGKPWGTPNPRVEEAVIPSLMVGIDNFLVDLLIAYIPMPLINSLNLSRKKKNGVLLLFAAGFIAVASDVVTLYFRVRLFERVDQLLYGYITHNCALIESSISVILSSLPSSAKIWHVHIEPSQMYQSLRSRFTSSRTSQISHNSDNDFPSDKDSRPVRKKRDPYSINMPSTNLSQAHLGDDGALGLQLTNPKDGIVTAQVFSQVSDERHPPGDIYRKVSVEQSSVSYPDSQKSSKQQDMI